ncbi:MAG: anthranilate synthase component I family protein [Lachnospiraceae bacterium]|nr:anthranilate synthase component I family protein [Lachnospiraceae bacterium]
MIQPTLGQCQQIFEARQFKMIPLSLELFADITTPIEVLKRLKTVSKHCFILESAERSENWGRYTFLGFDPKLEVSCLNGLLKITSAKDSQVIKTENPNVQIQKILDAHKSVKFDYLPPFAGGLVGYFAYDYVKYTEFPLQSNICKDEYFRDVDLMLFDQVIAFDHYRQKIILIVNISLEKDDLVEAYAFGKKRLERLVELVQQAAVQPPEPAQIHSEFKALFTEAEYCQMVKKAKDYIKEDEILQVVLSNRFEAEFTGSLLETYRHLRTINPSPYMFYFSGSDGEVMGASPETLVKLQDGTLSTFPLAGTRPRGENEAEDKDLEKELLADQKELAEHNMLVDLGCSDLGKISKLGTVKVAQYLTVLKFSHVMHIGSTITGEIQDGLSGLDAIQAILPAGTLSGAPKVRAMEIIHDLERNKRGIYGGAIGYLDFTGNMDTCIAIRLAYRRKDKVFIRAGAGIVADSKPSLEYQECLNKAKAVKKALEQSVAEYED